MQIAVNASSLSEKNLDFFLKFAASYPKEKLVFIFDSENINFSFPQNIIPVVLKRKPDSEFHKRIWYNIKIPAILKKYKANIFISQKAISMRTKVPQILISPDLRYIYQPSILKKKDIRSLQKNTTRFLNKADQIVVTSHFFEKEIIERFRINEEKIKVIYPEIGNRFKGINFEEKESVKEKYAEGNEYFIYNGIVSTEQNLVNLLKAFSFFKKRQKSKMQLVITGKRGAKYEEFVRSLQSYRFRNDVKIIEEVMQNENEKILASAYAMVYVPFYESEGDSVIEAMKCESPLIVSDAGFLKEYCSDAALYVDPNNYKDIAEKMMQIFKDEKLRKELIEKETNQLNQFSDRKRGDILFELIKNTAIKTYTITA
jgi:glycosyltransferase involved in cell wall biosynthesis